jgi:hypothetical protein
MRSGLGKLVPDVKPVTVMFVNTLTTNFNLHGFDEFVTHPGVVITGLESGEIHLEIHTVDQITVTGHSACYFATETSGTVESLFNGFHREVGVTSVHHFEEGNLGVSGQVNVLGTVSDKLH